MWPTGGRHQWHGPAPRAPTLLRPPHARPPIGLANDLARQLLLMFTGPRGYQIPRPKDRGPPATLRRRLIERHDARERLGRRARPSGAAGTGYDTT